MSVILGPDGRPARENWIQLALDEAANVARRRAVERLRQDYLGGDESVLHDIASRLVDERGREIPLTQAARYERLEAGPEGQPLRPFWFPIFLGPDPAKSD